MGRLFVRAMLSQHGCVTVSILALSGAPRQLPQRGSLGRRGEASPFGSNSDDRRQWRKQGVAVGAAASRMRARAKQTLGAATRAVSPEVTERASPWRKGCSHSDRQALCQSDVIATWLRHCQHPCPLRRFAPALPKGEPLETGFDLQIDLRTNTS